MKKILVCFVLAILSYNANAKKQVTIKAGTVVPLQAVSTVEAANVQEGETVDFQVSQDVIVDGVCAIPRGTLVKGVVSEAKKSSLAGTKGRLIININKMNMSNGEPIFFSNSIVKISGKNRTPLAVVTCLFVWPCIFIPGTKAVMPAGYEVLSTVASNVTTTI